MKKIIGFVVIAIVGVFLTMGILRSQETEEVLSIDDIQQREGIPIFAALAERRDVSISSDFFGTIQTGRQAVVTTQLMERIASIKVEEGDVVREGQILAVLDTSASMASVSQARVQYLNVKRDRERMEALLAEGGISKQEFDQINAAFEVAEENYHTARNLIELIAPISGVVARIEFNEGDIAQPGDPVITILDDSSYEIVFDVTQENRRQLHTGQEVKVTIGSNGEELTGHISRISLSAAPETRLFQARAELSSSVDLFSGEMASINVVISEADNVVAVPPDAILERDGQAFVFVIRDNTVAKRQPVQRGLVGETFVEVVQGLQEGDLIATYGHNSLEDGATVKLIVENAISTSLE